MCQGTKVYWQICLELMPISSRMSIEEKETAKEWYTTHGVEATKMYGGELYGNWLDNKPGRRNMTEF